MIEHFIYLLEDIAVQPSEAISQLRILGDQEKQQLLIDWNATYKGVSKK